MRCSLQLQLVETQIVLSGCFVPLQPMVCEGRGHSARPLQEWTKVHCSVIFEPSITHSDAEYVRLICQLNSQSCLQAEDWWGILCPEESYRHPPGWLAFRQLMLEAAKRHPWSHRDSKLFFRGGSTGKASHIPVRIGDCSSIRCWSQDPSGQVSGARLVAKG